MTDTANVEPVEKPKRKYTRRAAARSTAAKRRAPVRAAQPQAPASHIETPEGFEDVPLRRRARSERQEHRFGVPDSLKQRGFDYAYWPMEVLGQPVSRSDITDVYHGGWRPVKAEEMPGMMPPGDTSEFVEDGGQRLYKRPMAFTDEAKAEERSLAQQATTDRIQAATRGQVRGGQGMDVPGVRTRPLEMSIEAEAGTYKGR